MGKLTYNSTLTVNLEDRLLAHLEAAIGTKLQHGEGCYFSWTDCPSGIGRTTIWLHPQISLSYKYASNSRPPLNAHWIHALLFTANSPAGLEIVLEPRPQPRVPGLEAAGNQARGDVT
ncbi:hypothetical protein RCH16_002031 [Cryobacterium sp. MP_M5]|uniref:DUF7882 family protein n=1 Tax=unclassified Cryobacterium TaxID=2649013 RepID=UPI0018CACD07|nr:MULTISPECIES: ATP-dependent DNA ligase [unclassified Cryobacterium]MBG6059681.1 hypothetical protein [Cryobacterium sp. MP_M3]MEC5177021.1 hypothetical protein [Cryobacterium sp. MP_M5]